MVCPSGEAMFSLGRHALSRAAAFTSASARAVSAAGGRRLAQRHESEPDEPPSTFSVSTSRSGLASVTLATSHAPLSRPATSRSFGEPPRRRSVERGRPRDEEGSRRATAPAYSAATCSRSASRRRSRTRRSDGSAARRLRSTIAASSNWRASTRSCAFDERRDRVRVGRHLHAREAELAERLDAPEHRGRERPSARRASAIDARRRAASSSARCPGVRGTPRAAARDERRGVVGVAAIELGPLVEPPEALERHLGEPEIEPDAALEAARVGDEREPADVGREEQIDDPVGARLWPERLLRLGVGPADERREAPGSAGGCMAATMRRSVTCSQNGDRPLHPRARPRPRGGSGRATGTARRAGMRRDRPAASPDCDRSGSPAPERIPDPARLALHSECCPGARLGGTARPRQLFGARRRRCPAPVQVRRGGRWGFGGGSAARGRRDRGLRRWGRRRRRPMGPAAGTAEAPATEAAVGMAGAAARR